MSREADPIVHADLLEKLLEPGNLNAAYLKVRSNGGSAGVDGMQTTEMLGYLKEHGRELVATIRAGKYKPKPVKRVRIPKPDGGERLLGVPTVIDRMVQQAILQVLQPIYEPRFSEHSYGFRPKRSAIMAMRQTQKYYEEGYRVVVDIDLAKFFDTVNHEMLMNMLRETVKEPVILSLIKAFLKSGVMEDGLVTFSEEGTPQGGPLSPLLSNIYLTVFDRELEKRGHKFIRYADDCNIYVQSRRAAERVMSGCVDFLEKKLKLKVNREKSTIGSPVRLKFLGFSLYRGAKGTKLRIHEKSLAKFKKRVKEITSRKRGRSVHTIIAELNRFIVGWLNYFVPADAASKLRELDEWIRRRIRSYIWKQWKKPSARLRNLAALGIDREKAYEWSYTRKGYWRTARSPILHRALTNEHLASMGLISLSQRYEVLHMST